MATVTVKVKGRGKLRRNSLKASAAILDALADAVKESTDEIADDARSGAPVGTPATLRGSGEPGELRDSIEADVDGLSGEVGVQGEASEYAPHVEHGTSKMDAQPFMGPAAERGRNTLPANVKAEVRKALR